MNAAGKKRALSFRDIVRYCMVDETSIQSEESPVLSGQHINDPTERSVFKLLLTGIDDSALGVWSRSLVGHSYRVIRRMRYGPSFTRERHNDRGGPSSDTA